MGAATRDGRRRLVASVGTGVLLVLAAASCADEPGFTPRAVVSVPDAERRPFGPGEASEGARVVDAFAADLYRVVAASQPGNLVLSPWSIVTALGMTRAGASGTTAAQLDQVLHVSDEARLHGGLNALGRLVAASGGTFLDPDGETKEVVVSPANRLFGQEGFAVEPAFESTMRGSYGAELEPVDYRADPEGARRHVNAWVAERTRGEVAELLPPRSVTDRTVLSLVDALFLSAPWVKQFDDPVNHSFTRLDGSAVAAPFVSRSSTWYHAAGEGWRAVRVPYGGNELEMVLVVPDPGRFADGERLIGEGLFAARPPLTGVPVPADSAPGTLDAAWTTGLGPLSIPIWTTDSQLALQEPLEALGLVAGFDPNRADFSRISTQMPLYLSDVHHGATIAVDAKGTVATAGTAAEVQMPSAPPPFELVVDRPFLYALRHIDTGAVLFLGRVLDPTAP